MKDFSKKAIRNILHANIDVHSRRLITGLSGDGKKRIEKLQQHCANTTFADKVDMTGFPASQEYRRGICNELQ